MIARAEKVDILSWKNSIKLPTKVKKRRYSPNVSFDKTPIPKSKHFYISKYEEWKVTAKEQ